jgi:hypothetical protein
MRSAWFLRPPFFEDVTRRGLVVAYPEVRMSQLHHGGSLKSHNALFFCNVVAGGTEISGNQLRRG